MRGNPLEESAEEHEELETSLGHYDRRQLDRLSADATINKLSIPLEE